MKPVVPGIALRQARDARGVVFEPLDAVQLGAQRNVHVVLSAPGAVRGNHFHRVLHEVTVVMGPARVAWRPASVAVAPAIAGTVGAAPVAATAAAAGAAPTATAGSVDVPAGEAWRFEFPPGIAHAYLNTGQETQVLVAFSSEPHDPADPDTFRDPVID